MSTLSSSKSLGSAMKLAAVLLLSSSFSAMAEGPVEIYKPANDIEKAAQDMLDKHCARCHQDGKLVKREKPAKGFGDVMQLDQMLGNPDRVVPGTPDASKIFQVIVNGQMPKDVFEGESTLPAPTAEEIDSLRTWITKAAGECKVEAYEPKLLIKEMYDDLFSLPEHVRPTTRYLTLANISSACATEEEMEVYRQGAVKVLNSLSQNSDVIKMKEVIVGERKDIIRIDLVDLNWTPELWDYIIAGYPYGIDPVDSQHKAMVGLTHTELPYIRADWLGFFGTRSPLYEKILGLPDTVQELQSQLKFDMRTNIQNRDVDRAGFKKSGVSRSNRLIERHRINDGYFWTSYDFAATKGTQNLMENPLGPTGSFGTYDGNAYAFTEDGGESIWSLPNGFQAYYLNKATGEFLPKGPTEIVQDPGRVDLAVANGISCMGCHDQGMRNAVDDIAPHVTKNKIFPSDVREIVKSIYPDKEEMDGLIKEDADRFVTAMKRAGLNPNLKLNGDEMANALSNRYERDLDLRSAAAEFGTTPEELKDYLRGAGDVGGSIASQLSQGTVQRDIFEAEFGNLVENVIDADFIKPSTHETSYGEIKKKEVIEEKIDTFKIELFAKTPAAEVGKTTAFVVKATKDCYLTMVNIDQQEVGTVLFPNKFEQDNFIKAGQEYLIPAQNATYDYTFQSKGTETVIGLCDITGKSLPKITHDFKAEAYTSLGRGISVGEKLDVVAPVKKSKKQVTEDVEEEYVAPVSNVARTAIKIEVY
jgi:Domain of unknown function (DUF4384)